MKQHQDNKSNQCQFHKTAKEKLGNGPKDGILLACELAEVVGLDPKTVRFQGRIGLIVPSSHGKIKVYMNEDATRLFSIRKFRQFGFSISEIRRIKEIEGRTICPVTLLAVRQTHGATRL
jgi:hypothetical protein